MGENLLEQIKEQGDLVRKLKAAKESPAKVSIIYILQLNVLRIILL